MFRRKRAEAERKKREAILRGVYEDNLQLREPGYYSPKRTRQQRRGIRILTTAIALLIVAIGPLYQLVAGMPPQPSISIQHAPAMPTRTAGGDVMTAAASTDLRIVPAAGTLSSPAPEEIVLSGPAIEALREAPTDARSAGQPTIRDLFGLSARTIVIDAGHGGRDPGTIGRAGTREKDITLDIAQRLKEKIGRSPQYRIFLVRDSDTFITLNERAAYANSRDTDLFISIHVNYLSGTSKNAVETYYFGQYQDLRTRELAQRENRYSSYTISEFGELAGDIKDIMKLEESKALANSIQTSMLSNFRQQNQAVLDTGVKAAPFVVLLGVKAPSVLAEIASLNSPEAESRLSEEHYRDEIATYLAAGITEYLNNQPMEGEAHHVKGKDRIGKQ
jgi:N-acetylmuramoyl-L-alanine amidase